MAKKLIKCRHSNCSVYADPKEFLLRKLDYLDDKLVVVDYNCESDIAKNTCLPVQNSINLIDSNEESESFKTYKKFCALFKEQKEKEQQIKEMEAK